MILVPYDADMTRIIAMIHMLYDRTASVISVSYIIIRIIHHLYHGMILMLYDADMTRIIAMIHMLYDSNNLSDMPYFIGLLL